ncbi:CoA pyrophosphatase [Leucobacter sp. cx-42]|uniref:NUDIX hydrolase n=1 Tax=unclassified Leucobacter TaxID=2621730 RepID=UPI00165E1A78|nr:MULTISPECIES: CoA pyrophosphatase [unclassified Leucobacter]MBC9953945.1 CoA pyrophosphatase [Leucobacter sp. cx-42]
MSLTPDVARAREELSALLERGMDLRITPQAPPNDRPYRHSSVLILFGALDRKPSLRADSSPVSRDLDVLLMRRSSQLRHHAGEISFPGGGAEAHDPDAVATALREANEETGLDPAGVEVLGTLPEVAIPVSNNLVTPVVGWWCAPSEVRADESESVEVFRVPVADMLDPASRGTSVLRRGGLSHRGPAFQLTPKLGRHIVWGFTGILLSSMYDELGWTQPWDRKHEFPLSK